MTASETLSVPVFVVEDQEDILQVLTSVLGEAGFAVTSARDGQEAMAMLDAEGASYRALITDVNLPGTLTGWDVARHAREANDLLPVVYMTGASAHEWGSRGVPNSVLLLKPFAMAQIVATVSQLVTASATLATNTAAIAAADKGSPGKD